VFSLPPINPNHPWNKTKSRKNKTDKQRGGGLEQRRREQRHKEKRRKLGA